MGKSDLSTTKRKKTAKTKSRTTLKQRGEEVEKLAGETKHIKECKFAPSLHFILAFDWMIASTLEIGIKTKSDKIQGCNIWIL